MVERAFVIPPASKLGTISDELRNELIQKSIYYHKYSTIFDRESAYEVLQKKLTPIKDEPEINYSKNRRYNYGGYIPKRRKSDSVITKMAKSAASSIGRQIGRELIRGLFGILLKR